MIFSLTGQQSTTSGVIAIELIVFADTLVVANRVVIDITKVESNKIFITYKLT